MDQPTQNQNLFDLQVDHIFSNHLSEAAKWAKFLGIVGMIFCGLFVLLGVFAGSVLSMIPMMGESASALGSIGAGFLTAIYLVFALIYFFPCLYLFRFGSNAQTAIRSNEQAKLQSSIKNLKSCFKFMGILLIIGLIFYVLAFIGLIATTAFMY